MVAISRDSGAGAYSKKFCAGALSGSFVIAKA
jgi:hypothetical protein